MIKEVIDRVAKTSALLQTLGSCTRSLSFHPHLISQAHLARGPSDVDHLPIVLGNCILWNPLWEMLCNLNHYPPETL